MASCLAISPAYAQLKPELQTGSMIPAKPQTVDKRRFGEVRKEFARCIYFRAKPKAKALLEHSDVLLVDLAGAQIKDIGSELDLDDCLGEQVGIDESALGMSTHIETLRDMLAEEAYLADHRTAPVLAPDSPPMTFSLLPNNPNPSMAQALAAFADCTIRHDVGGTDALLRTMPSSDQEQEKAAALAPAMGACLTAGQQLTLNAANIRAVMAFAMWTRFRS
jgi:hypothetical protein